MSNMDVIYKIGMIHIRLMQEFTAIMEHPIMVALGVNKYSEEDLAVVLAPGKDGVDGLFLIMKMVVVKNLLTTSPVDILKTIEASIHDFNIFKEAWKTATRENINKDPYVHGQLNNIPMIDLILNETLEEAEARI